MSAAAPANVRIYFRCEQAFQNRPNSHAKKNPATSPIKGLVIANQNAKKLLGSGRVWMVTGSLLLQSRRRQARDGL